MPDTSAIQAIRSGAELPLEGARASAGAAILSLLLLCGDAALILLHVAGAFGADPNPYRIDAERGTAEAYQYLKFLWLVLLTVHVAYRRGSPHFLAWSAVFLYMLADDSLQLHEHLGAALGGILFPDLRLAATYGEFAFFVLAGLLLVGPLAWAWVRGDAFFRSASVVLAGLMAAMVVCGVAVDAVHSLVPFGRALEFAIGLLEDGGEMVVASLLVGYAFSLPSRSSRSS